MIVIESKRKKEANTIKLYPDAIIDDFDIDDYTLVLWSYGVDF